MKCGMTDLFVCLFVCVCVCTSKQLRPTSFVSWQAGRLQQGCMQIILPASFFKVPLRDLSRVYRFCNSTPNKSILQIITARVNLSQQTGTYMDNQKACQSAECSSKCSRCVTLFARGQRYLPLQTDTLHLPLRSAGSCIKPPLIYRKLAKW